MQTSSLKIYISDENRTRLEELCEALDVSPQRGKTFLIGKLIEHATAPEGNLQVREFAPKETTQLLREHYQNLSRVGGNLNQFIHLLQIRRLRLERGEDDELKVEVPFLVAVLKELLEDVEELKGLMVEITERY